MRCVSSEIVAFDVIETPGQSTVAIILTIKRTGDALGSIRWDVKWRQYAFTPAPGARYALRCLTDIHKQLRALMRGWEKQRLANAIDSSTAQA